jgi:hypothetical protein
VKSRGSGIPVLMPRAMRFTHCRGRDDAKHRRKTGARQPVPGKSAYKPQNHRAGKVGTFRPNLWYLPPAFFVAGGPWERPAPDLPCALTLPEGDESSKNSGQTCRENEGACDMRDRVAAELRPDLGGPNGFS